MLRLCLVWLLAPTEVALDVDAELDVEWLYPGAEEPAADNRHRLQGHVLPGLVNYEGLDWAIEAEGLQGFNNEFTTEVRLLAQGEIEHPFVSEIRDLSIAVGLYLPTQAQDAFERLTMPPLQLTQADLDRKLPSPMATLSGGSVVVESAKAGGRTAVSIEQDLGVLSLSWHDMPAYVALTEGYALLDPAAGDIKLILERGGTADFAALARWANDHEDSPPDFDPQARQEIMELVQGTYRRLRAPPALGDFQRLGALVSLIRTLGASEDIESLLKLERPMKILHTSALLSYDLAVREEAFLGLPVHGMRDLPAQSKLLEAPEAALKALRAPALHHLLRLAFDPLDFRDAPAAMASTSASLSAQAANLLAPLTTTDVVGVLNACAEDTNVEHEVLRFYVDARHQPAVDHLVDWLTDHPESISDLGARAIAAMPEAMLAPLMRHYVDPQDPEHRAGMRRLLEAMPNAQTLQILQMLQSLGLHIAHLKGTPQEQVTQAFTEFELAERKYAGEKAKQLVDQLKEAGSDIASLRTSVRAATRLYQLDPTAIEDNARLVIDLLTAAALEFDAESPAERARVLGYLGTFPFGELQEEARRAAALTEARLSIQRGATQDALDQLLEFDGSLSQIEVRTLFIETLMMQYRKELASGAFNEASSTLDLAERRIPDNLDIEVLRHELLWTQYKPAFILGAAFALALVTTLTWLIARLILDLPARLVRARKEVHRLLRRQADAKANTEDAARFSEPDFEVGRPPPASATKLIDGTTSNDAAANDPPPAEALPNQPSYEQPKTPPSSSKPVIDDALLGEFAVDDGFDDPLGDPLGDPFDDLNDDPFSDEFGWGQDLSPSEVRNG